MRCGKILVDGEAEDIIPVSPKPAKPRQRRSHHGKKSSSNPYSSIGLDKFYNLNAELSAKREYVARKTGSPKTMVRFSYTRKGWVPVVVKNGEDGEVSILRPTKLHKEINNIIQKGEDENDDAKADAGFENDVNGSLGSKETVTVIIPWWSGFLRSTAFGVLTVIAMLVRNTAEAIFVVMCVGSVQMLLQGGVLCMKKFIDTRISYFFVLFLYWRRSPENKTRPSQGSLQVQQQPMASPEHRMLIISKRVPVICFSVRDQATVFSSPKNNSRRQELNTQLQGEKKKIFYGQPRKSTRAQQSDNLVRGAGRGTLGATVMIMLLFFLVFYGRFCAICFTSTLWYVLPNLRTDSTNPFISHDNNSKVVIDLQSKDYKKKVIMDGLLNRNHDRAI